MSQTVKRSRQHAYHTQGNRCFYCNIKMPNSLKEVRGWAKKFNLTPFDVKNILCTAEHIQAQCEGGNNKAENIVAACFHCNQARHAVYDGIDVESYKDLVKSELSKSNWHLPALIAKLM